MRHRRESGGGERAGGVVVVERRPVAGGSPWATAPLPGAAGAVSLQSVAQRREAGLVSGFFGVCWGFYFWSPCLSVTCQNPKPLVPKVPGLCMPPASLGLGCKTLCLGEADFTRRREKTRFFI